MKTECPQQDLGFGQIWHHAIESGFQQPTFPGLPTQQSPGQTQKHNGPIRHWSAVEVLSRLSIEFKQGNASIISF
jgi:hypothetical protein